VNRILGMKQFIGIGRFLAAALVISWTAAGQDARDLMVTSGKSLVVESPVNIERVSLANGDLAEAVVVNPRELLLHGKSPGVTSLIVWQQGGTRLLFDLNVQPNSYKQDTALEATRRELKREFPNDQLDLTMENGILFVRGTVSDMTSAERAMQIARTAGTAVNLLSVKVPPTEAQILLKVKFADVDRATSNQLGADFFSTGLGQTTGRVTTGQFQSGQVSQSGFSLNDALNVFLFRSSDKLAVAIKALQARRLLEILAEPNVLAYNGKSASFLSGGEFPYPTLQGGGGGLGAVTIQFREFGVRITFVPTVTPRGTIHLQVTPEVSSLDFANGLVFQGFNIPALATRRVQTELELESGQSFAIGGLLDNRVTQSLSKIPGLGDIPFFGKLFRTRDISKNKTELLVIVTPEIVRPIPAGQTVPDLTMPVEFLQEGLTVAPRTPGLEITGPVPVKAPKETMRVEDYQATQKSTQPATPAAAQIQFIPVPIMPAQPAAAPAPAPAPGVVPLPAPPKGNE
jgi:pilus assembly protein CpaC